MAKRVQVVLTDDIDGTDADETVSFALDGVSYEIDLSSGNADKLRSALAPWVGAAQRTGGRKAGGRRAGGRSARRGGVSAVREWARANGHQINDRGRVPAAIQEAYDKAHG
ncbi:MAG TPA: Lsr2 family protein [Dermatophilaceae bacterium]|nr:Lsr2 family protein [Dermatophilaceae bacterium]